MKEKKSLSAQKFSLRVALWNSERGTHRQLLETVQASNISFSQWPSSSSPCLEPKKAVLLLGNDRHKIFLKIKLKLKNSSQMISSNARYKKVDVVYSKR